MGTEVKVLKLSSIRGTHSTALQPGPVQMRRKFQAEIAGPVAEPNAEYTGMGRLHGTEEVGPSTVCISYSWAPSPDLGRITQPSQPFFLLSPDKDLEFSESILQAVTSHWLALVPKMDPVIYPFYLLFCIASEDFNLIM